MPSLQAVAIDKLAFTVPLLYDDAEPIAAHLNDLASNRAQGLLRLSNYTYNRRYRTGCHLLLNETTGAHCTLLAHPIGQQSSYIRFEWNPANAGPDGYARIRDFLNYLRFPGHDIDLTASTIQRLDVCVDIEGIHPDEILVDVSRMRVSSLYFDSRGRTESMYIGDVKEGKRYFVIYDKTAEIRRRTGRQIDQTTRIEVRYKPRNLTPHGLSAFSRSNPFELVSIQEWTAFEHRSIRNRSKLFFLDGLRWRNATVTSRADLGRASRPNLR